VLHRSAVIRAPGSGLDALTVSASEGDDPLVCVTWGEPLPEDTSTYVNERPWLTCHRGPTMATQLSMVPKGPGAVAVSPSGTRIAWTERKHWTSYPTTALLVADLGRRGLGRPTRAVSKKECPGECFEGRSPYQLAWAGEDALLLSMSCESDDGCDLHRLAVDTKHLAAGWEAGSSLVQVPDGESGYRYFDMVSTAGSTEALVVERPGEMNNEHPPPYRAVQIDVRNGRVLRMIATAAKDRWVTGVSGGGRGIAYTSATSSLDPQAPEQRFYVPLPGEKHGSQLHGVPAGVRELIAVAAPR
jgi:hypothetical protein